MELIVGYSSHVSIQNHSITFISFDVYFKEDRKLSDAASPFSMGVQGWDEITVMGKDKYVFNDTEWDTVINTMLARFLVMHVHMYTH